MSPAPALELSGILKSFGSVQALRGADFVLAPGEVHALLGENGAGKSSLLHIAFGMFPADGGVIRVRGSDVALRSPADARALGIGMVHQHFTSIGALTVAENIALAAGVQAARKASLGGGAQRDLDPNRRAEELSVALRQRLEVVKAMATGARILLLDEPSAALAPAEIDELLLEVKQFARAGGSVALVTHKLAEVFAAADRVTVLRQGASVLHGSVKTQTVENLALAMLGDSTASLFAQAPPAVGRVHRDVVHINEIGVGAGELIGIAAVEGNGQRELLRSIAGLERPPAGAVITVAPGTVGFIPEDRTTEGLIPELSITENFLLGRERDPAWARGSRIDWGSARRRVAQVIEEFGIRASGPTDRTANLSGGNQQKLVLARALDARPGLLVAENPTRGLDLRATAELHQRLRDATRRGVAVIVYSADLDEVLELGERVLVVCGGRVREAPAGADRQLVGKLMLGIGAP